jgi:hypothetical protein
MDLLSVVAHEMGHLVLQMEENAEPNDVMTEALPVGARRLPAPHDLGLEAPHAADSRPHALGLKDAVVAPLQQSFAPVVLDRILLPFQSHVLWPAWEDVSAAPLAEMATAAEAPVATLLPASQAGQPERPSRPVAAEQLPVWAFDHVLADLAGGLRINVFEEDLCSATR